jgi:DNA polymerase I
MSQSEEKKETFVIVDANAFVHSSFHGYTPKYDAKGQDQRVLYGIMNTLVDLTYQFNQIDHLYIIFDPSDGSLYRKSIFPAYKANRPPTDPDLARQRDMARKVIADHLGLPSFSYPGYEADDIIGSLAKLVGNSSNYEVFIVSPDKDIAQLVDENIKMLRRFRSKTERGYKLLTIETVVEHFGVYPHQIPDWLALVGDVADNLPGLEDVGEKRAATILKQYPSVEHLLAICHQLDNMKLKEKIESNKDTITLVKKLATIVTDLPIEEKTHEAMIKSKSIRSHQEYNKKLLTLQKYFAWPDYYLEMFLS